MSGNLKSEVLKKSVSIASIRPAFSSGASAAAFLILVVLTLGLPRLISISGAIERRDSYDITPETYGNYSFVAQEVFENEEPIDLVFVGSSLIWNAVDTPAVQAELSRHIGRSARVFTFGHYFNSVDVSYAQLRDLVERKHVRMVVLSIPRTPMVTGPSIGACRSIRYDDHPDVVSGLPLEGRASLYACSILRSPRDLLSVLRPNHNTPSRFASALGADRAEFGMERKSEAYESFLPSPPSIPIEKMIYSASTADMYRFTGDPLPPHQDHYLSALIAFLRQKKVPFMMINVPQYSEIHNEKIVEREDWSKRFGHIPLVGIVPSVLYAGLSDEDIKKLHYDPEHMNANGNALYTRAVLPAIIKTFDEYATKER